MLNRYDRTYKHTNKQTNVGDNDIWRTTFVLFICRANRSWKYLHRNEKLFSISFCLMKRMKETFVANQTCKQTIAIHRSHFVDR